MKKRRIVYATMVGDLFHRGHLEFIKQAKKLGDFLIIGLHPDDIAKRYKREPVVCFEDRKRIITLKGCRCYYFFYLYFTNLCAEGVFLWGYGGSQTQ